MLKDCRVFNCYALCPRYKLLRCLVIFYFSLYNFCLIFLWEFMFIVIFVLSLDLMYAANYVLRYLLIYFATLCLNFNINVYYFSVYNVTIVAVRQTFECDIMQMHVGKFYIYLYIIFPSHLALFTHFIRPHLGTTYIISSELIVYRAFISNLLWISVYKPLLTLTIFNYYVLLTVIY